MSYEKPLPSAGFIIAGILSLIAALLLRWMEGAMVDSGFLAVIVAVIGGICLVAGLWRFFSAFDAAALHRWQTVTAGKNDELATLAGERRSRAQAGTQGEEGRTVVAS